MTSLIKRNTKVLFCRQHERLPALDGIRAIAIIVVVGVHLVFMQGSLSEVSVSTYDTDSYIEEIFSSRVGRIFARGEFGVDLFFVLSGFLIGSILLKELYETQTLNLKRFYLRRFIRLLPVYFFVLLAGLAVYAIFLPTQIEGLTVWTFMANVFYVNNFVSIADAYMIWCWSLAIEEQFYTFCPLLLLLIFCCAKSTRTKIIWFVSIISLMVVVRAITIFYYDLSIPFPDLDVSNPDTLLPWDTVYTMPHTRMNQLIIGVFCALIHMRFGDQIKRICHKWWFQSMELFALLIIGWLATDWIYSNCETYIFDLPEWAKLTYYIGYHDLFSIATAIVIIGVLSGGGIVNRAVGGFLSMKFWYPIAQLSYSWYLVHMLVMQVTFPYTSTWFYDQFGLKTGFWLNGISVSLIGLFISYLLFVFIEKPSMDVRKTEWIKRLHG